MENKEKKQVYEAPRLSSVKIEMEQGIAAGSASISSPNVDDWQVEDQSQNISI